MPLERALTPGWRVDARVGALMTTRAGGVSAGPFASLNLGRSVGDDPAAVDENRRRLAAAIGAEPSYLSQVHGARVLRLDAPMSADGAQADAAVTATPGLACTVLVADCLPVLFAAPAARAVGAAHAGWRGLAAGVLEATVADVAGTARCDAAELVAWLGPCIGPRQFEVGADVLAAFGREAASPGPRFVPRADGSPRWLADLAGLARDRLAATGVTQISGGAWCTSLEASSFFSFRRDRVTGRMAAAVWIRR